MDFGFALDIDSISLSEQDQPMRLNINFISLLSAKVGIFNDRTNVRMVSCQRQRSATTHLNLPLKRQRLALYGPMISPDRSNSTEKEGLITHYCLNNYLLKKGSIFAFVEGWAISPKAKKGARYEQHFKRQQ